MPTGQFTSASDSDVIYFGYNTINFYSKDSFEFQEHVDYIPGGKIGRGTYVLEKKQLSLKFDDSFKDNNKNSKGYHKDSIEVNIILEKVNSSDSLLLTIDYTNTDYVPLIETIIYYNEIRQGALYAIENGVSTLKIIDNTIVDCKTCLQTSKTFSVDEIEIGYSTSQHKRVKLTELDNKGKVYKIVRHEFYYNTNDTKEYIVKRKRKNTFRFHLKDYDLFEEYIIDRPEL